MLSIISEYWIFLLIGEYPRGPVGGLAMTLIIAACSLAATFPCAVMMALARTSGLKVLTYSATAFVYVVRGLPLLMLVFWVYFFLPVVLGFPLSGFSSIVISIVIFQTAYLSEVIRAAIEAIPRGQQEAARSLGLTYVPIMLKVVLPQALYNAIPGILNQLTAIIKETSLGYIISVHELTHSAGQINSFLLTRPFEVFAILACAYFILCFTLTRAARGLEQRIERGRIGAEAA